MNRSRQQRFRHREVIVIPAGTVSIAALLAQPNIWSNWMDAHEFEALAWPRFVALMLRDVSPAAMLAVLAPALLEAAAGVQQALVSEELEGDYLPIRFDDWLSGWRGTEWTCVNPPVEQALSNLATSPDIAWLVEEAALLDPLSLLWLLLHGLKAVPKHRWETWQDVSQNDLWLIDLLNDPKAYNDPPAAVLSALYQTFHEAHPDITLPVPDIVKRANPMFVDARDQYAPKWLLAKLEPRLESSLGLDSVREKVNPTGFIPMVFYKPG